MVGLYARATDTTRALRYLDALSTRDPGTPVRAIIVTGPGGAAHSSTFAEHVTSRYEIDWFTYEVAFTLAVRHIGTDHMDSLRRATCSSVRASPVRDSNRGPNALSRRGGCRRSGWTWARRGASSS